MSRMPATGSRTSSSLTSMSSRPASSPGPGRPRVPRRFGRGHGRGSGRASADDDRRARRTVVLLVAARLVALLARRPAARPRWASRCWLSRWLAWLSRCWPLLAAALARRAAGGRAADASALRRPLAVLLAVGLLARPAAAVVGLRAHRHHGRPGATRRSPVTLADGRRPRAPRGRPRLAGASFASSAASRLGERVAARCALGALGCCCGAAVARRGRAAARSRPRAHGRARGPAASADGGALRRGAASSACAGACAREPPRASVMASTRSPLRILDVPLTPSSAASACSSGRRSAEIAGAAGGPAGAAHGGLDGVCHEGPFPSSVAGTRWTGDRPTSGRGDRDGAGSHTRAAYDDVCARWAGSLPGRLLVDRLPVTYDAGDQRTRSGERVDAITVGSADRRE